ncbi:MAG: hypothetical protein R3F04_05155 [Lysobacteraceae bacterium]
MPNTLIQKRFSLFFLSVLLAACGVMLSACQSGPKVRIFPPSASLQELRVEPSGQWVVLVRLQNYSTVGMRLQMSSAQLSIDGLPPLSLAASEPLMVATGSTEILEVRVSPDTSLQQRIDAALQSRKGVGYHLSGEILSLEPRERRDAFEFSSSLTPMPGLPGVLR